MVSYVHVAQSLSQSVKAVLVFLIYNRITVKTDHNNHSKVQDTQANLKTTIIIAITVAVCGLVFSCLIGLFITT